MLRRINWQEGDSSPDWANIVLNVYGDGQIQVDTGFPTSAATVGFARTYLQNILDAYGNTSDLAIRVIETNDTGFLLEYENVPLSIPLELNYYAM